MVNLALKLYYQKKVRIALDVLDELERLQNDPNAPAIVKQNAEEAQLAWEREFTLAHAEYDGVKLGLSTLPLPPPEIRLRLGQLSDEVEKQINVNKAAVLAVTAAGEFISMIDRFKQLA